VAGGEEVRVERLREKRRPVSKGLALGHQRPVQHDVAGLGFVGEPVVAAREGDHASDRGRGKHHSVEDADHPHQRHGVCRVESRSETAPRASRLLRRLHEEPGEQESVERQAAHAHDAVRRECERAGALLQDDAIVEWYFAPIDETAGLESAHAVLRDRPRDHHAVKPSWQIDVAGPRIGGLNLLRECVADGEGDRSARGMDVELLASGGGDTPQTLPHDRERQPVALRIGVSKEAEAQFVEEGDRHVRRPVGAEA
jgi:hypothetical protein